MNASAESRICRTDLRLRLAHLLALIALLPVLASCVDAGAASSSSTSKTSRPSAELHTAVLAVEPGCRQEFPVEFRGISCAGHDYDPPPIPFGELYPPR